MGFDVREWKNPDGAVITNDGTSSVAAQFDEFLNRSGRFNSLDLTDSTFSTQTETPEDQNAKPRITLLEEFPGAFTQSSTSAQSFRSSILRYLATNKASQSAIFEKSRRNAEQNPPLVMIISETLLTSSFASSDSFTAYRLLGPDISNHPGICTIEFNAVAPTYLSKALDLILKKVARKSGRRRIPGPAVLKQLSESGDVRSAIGSLEFMCLRGDDQSDWGGRVAAKTKRSDRQAMTSMEKESLEMVTQREATLGIFHAVGKVVYNKRDIPKAPESLIDPPEHLSSARRPKVPDVDVEELIDETGTDTQTFIAALHENFLLSCDGSSFTDNFEGCIGALSDSDLLNLSSFRGLRSNTAGIGTGRTSYQGTNMESLRQDESSFQVAVRGLLFALPYPVKRGYGTTPVGSINGRPVGRGDTFKMFYPTSSRLWKQTEETEGLLTTWIDRNMLNDGFSKSSTERKTSGVESWKNRNNNRTSMKSDDDGSGSLAVRSSRMEILLERLPYVAQISRQKPLPSDLDKLTKFRGVEAQNEDILEDDDDEQGIGGPPDTPSRRKAGKWMAATKENARAIPVENDVEKLVLSDDDIEDD
jgi:cell cycle checkpoint protein